MPARIVRQNREIKEFFRAKIREKVERERELMRAHIEEEVPSWIRWALKPLAEVGFSFLRARDNARGESGENNAFLHFWLLLPNSWVLVDSVVLEPEPEEFAQIDHLLIGPPGIFLIETKAWEGAFLGFKDTWKRKEGNSWIKCESPTKQNLRHKRLFVEWLRGSGLALPGDPAEYTFPVVLFTRSQWLKAEQCSMPVFRDGAELVGYLRRCARERQILSPGTVDAIAQAVAEVKPICVQFRLEQVQKISTKSGKYCVRARGERENAEALRQMYLSRRKTTSTLFSDKYEPGWWCFYVD